MGMGKRFLGYGKKILGLGLLAMVLTFGITACGEEEEPEIAKKIVITGLGDKTGYAMIGVVSDIESLNVIAAGEATLSGKSSATFSLMDQYSSWTGSGSYYLILYIFGEDLEGDDYSAYLYTNGKSLTAMSSVSAIPKYNITSPTSTIPLSKFLDVTELFDY